MKTKEQKQNTISLNPVTYEKLNKAYNKALKEDKEIFTFEGSELLTKFAKYLLEHMRNVLGIKQK